MRTHGMRTFTAYAATGGVAILALAALQIAADRIPSRGLQSLRNFLTHSTGN